MTVAQETVTGYCHGLNQTQESNITIANETVRVFCDLDTPNGPWITILKHTAGSGLFNKDFATFERGFGDVNHDHFIGEYIGIVPLMLMFLRTQYNT